MPPRKKVSEPTEAVSDSNTPDAPVLGDTPKKRERKNKKNAVVAVVTADGIQGSFTPDMKRPLIVHLPIHSSDVKFHDQPLVYDPAPPCQPTAYDAGLLDPFSMEAGFEALNEAQLQLEMTNGDLGGTTLEQIHAMDKKTNDLVRDVKPREYGPTKLLVQYEKMKQTQTLPTETDVACFWCCETFPGRPCVIPRGIVDDVWHVYGNFCTPPCAMAYLLSENLDTHVRWERIACLNQLYGATGRVYPAPSRETLVRFGGPISAQDFRTLCESQKTRVDIHIPPMVSILASMDTKPIDFYETPVRTNLVSASQPQTRTEDTTLKLRRTKPLKNKESTLDACLQIRVKGR